MSNPPAELLISFLFIMPPLWQGHEAYRLIIFLPFWMMMPRVSLVAGMPPMV